jgi:hypothetical protein
MMRVAGPSFVLHQIRVPLSATRQMVLGISKHLLDHGHAPEGVADLVVHARLSTNLPDAGGGFRRARRGQWAGGVDETHHAAANR